MDHRTRRALQPSGLPQRATESHCRHASWAAGRWFHGGRRSPQLNGHIAGGGRCGGAGLHREHRDPGPDHLAVFLDRGRMHTIGFDPHLRDANRPAEVSHRPFLLPGLGDRGLPLGRSAAGTRSPGRSAAPDAPAPSCGNARRPPRPSPRATDQDTDNTAAAFS